MRTLHVLLGLFCAISVPLCGQMLQWEPTKGQFGGIIYSLTLTDSTGFAGTGGSGVFRFTLNSDGWTPVSNGLTNKYVGSLTNTGGAVYAGTWGNGVFRSTDNGESWTELNSGLNSPDVQVLASDSTTIYAGTSDGLYSISAGDTLWKDFGVSLPNRYILKLCTIGSRVYASTNDGQLFRTADNGKSWKELTLPVTGAIRSLTANSAAVFVGMDSALYRSTDNGEHWTQSGANGGLPTASIGALAAGRTTVYAGSRTAGLYYSEDNGFTWHLSAKGMYYNSVIALAAKGDAVLAGTHIGQGYRSGDAGKTWNGINNALIPTATYCAITLDKQIYVGTSDGVYRTSDRGNNWYKDYPAVGSSGITALTTVDSILLIGTSTDGLFRVEGRSGSAAKITDTLFTNADTTNKRINTIIARGESVYVDVEGVIIHSSDKGKTWKPLLADSLTVSAVAPLSDGKVLFAVVLTKGFSRSDDGGATWTYNAIDFGAEYVPSRSLIRLSSISNVVYLDIDAVRQSDNSTVTFRTKSRDGGKTWVGSNVQDTRNLVSTGPFYFQLNQKNGIVISVRNDSSWVAVNDGMPEGFIPLGITCELSADTVFFAATNAHGVYRTKSVILSAVDDHIENNTFQPVIIPNPAGSNGASVALGRVDGCISLTLRDAIGRAVRTVYNGDVITAPTVFTINTDGIPAGIYYLTGYAGSRAVCLPLVIVR